MGSVVVSFRFDDSEIDLLKIFSDGDESLNQTAARLVREAIGASLKSEGKENTKRRLQDEIESRVDEMLRAELTLCQQQVDKSIQDLQKQIDELKKSTLTTTDGVKSKRSKSSASTVKKPIKDSSEVIE